MRKFLVGALATALMAVVGCNRSEPGGPGVAGKVTTSRPATTSIPAQTTTTTTEPTHGSNTTVLGNPKNNTFEISAPIGTTHLKQGESKQLDVSIKRSNDFKEDVTLTFRPEKGLSVEPSSHTVKASDDPKVKITVSAAKDAPIAEGMVNIEGKPSAGQPTSVEFKVSVSKGS